jgi:hypothetical protein
LVDQNPDLAEAVNVKRIGEEAVVDNLKQEGWTGVVLNVRGPNLTDIQAKNPGGAMHLFQVKTAVSPKTPNNLSDVERTALISRARRMDAVAYQVKVQLNEKYTATRIQYSQL